MSELESFPLLLLLLLGSLGGKWVDVETNFHSVPLCAAHADAGRSTPKRTLVGMRRELCVYLFLLV